MNIGGSVKQSTNDTNKNKKSRQTQDKMSPKKLQNTAVQATIDIDSILNKTTRNRSMCLKPCKR